MRSQETMNTIDSDAQLVIFYDGQCPLCSREVSHYARRDRHNVLRLVDIAEPSFDAVAEGVDPLLVHARFHVRLADGQLTTGVDAFAAIWEALEIWPLARVCARNRLLRIPLDLGYVCFARIRPLFRRKACQGSCSIS
ncbi:MAG: putative DCC family thiol-disulfide oxidoreductase YuxK [Rhodothermales bacterium]|jgi:predicted DCC family thiol-disulfide oxidoreductase YuxK